MKKHSFRKWLLEQARRNDLIGDLTTDVKNDSDRPAFATYEEWHAHLTRRGACKEAKAALRLAWNEFQRTS